MPKYVPRFALHPLYYPFLDQHLGFGSSKLQPSEHLRSRRSATEFTSTACVRSPVVPGISVSEPATAWVMPNSRVGVQPVVRPRLRLLVNNSKVVRKLRITSRCSCYAAFGFIFRFGLLGSRHCQVVGLLNQFPTKGVFFSQIHQLPHPRRDSQGPRPNLNLEDPRV